MSECETRPRGGSRDFGNAVAADDEGNAYIGGRTDYYTETDSLPVRNAFQPDNASFGDAWVAKISPTPSSPLVNSLCSRGGPGEGGTTVVISGTGFTGTTAVKFVSPARAAGKVDVTFTAPSGTSPDNPVTAFEYAGLWTLTDSLNAVHYDHQSKLLDDGRVLLIGGTNSMFGGGIATTKVYDPTTRQWSETDPLNTARSAYSATRLDGPACRSASPADYCGDILVAGGSPNIAAGDRTHLTTSEIYDAESDRRYVTGSPSARGRCIPTRCSRATSSGVSAGRCSPSRFWATPEPRNRARSRKCRGSGPARRQAGPALGGVHLSRWAPGALPRS